MLDISPFSISPTLCADAPILKPPSEHVVDQQSIYCTVLVPGFVLVLNYCVPILVPYYISLKFFEKQCDCVKEKLRKNSDRGRSIFSKAYVLLNN